MNCLFLIFLLMASLSHAQEQVALRLNEKGILRILNLALKANAPLGSKTLVIPQDLYKFTLPQNELTTNPLVTVINETSDLNLHKGLDFYLKTSEMHLTGTVSQESLRAKISKTTSTGFDLKLSIDLPEVIVQGSSLSLCESKKLRSKECGAGLKTTVTKLKIRTRNMPLKLSVDLRILLAKEGASVKVLSITSNLDKVDGPELDIAFDSLTVPTISVIINGQEGELDTSGLRDVILRRKSFLAKKLLGFAYDFMAKDLTMIVNAYLSKKKLPTSWGISHHDDARPSYLEIEEPKALFEVDNTYVRLPLNIGSVNPSPQSLGEIMEEQISAMIRSSSVSLSLQSILTPMNKDLQFGGLLSMMLNDRVPDMRNRLSNRDVATLPPIDLTSFRGHDINLSLSEPVINGALDLVSGTGLFQALFEKFSYVPGFSLGKVQVHFAKDHSLRAIVNAQIDLNNVDSDGFGGWLKKHWAIYRERNNNHGKIYFPIEMKITPSLLKLASGASALELFVSSPFNDASLVNTFSYPSNISEMKKEVKSAVVDELKKSLGQHVEKSYVLDVSKFLNQSGVIFKPISISFEQGAYMLINLDVQDIDFKKPQLLESRI